MFVFTVACLYTANILTIYSLYRSENICIPLDALFIRAAATAAASS